MKHTLLLCLSLLLFNTTFAQMVDGGSGHSLVLDKHGTLWTCGKNNFGQLGDGTFAERTVPAPIHLPPVRYISRACDHAMAIDESGDLWLWGRNNYGQLGTSLLKDFETPQRLQGHTGFVMVKGGHWHSVALKQDGTVWTWGHNFYGELGNGSREHDSWPNQVIYYEPAGNDSVMHKLGNIVQVACFGYHSLALDSTGRVWAWGPNEYKALGHDINRIQPYATRIEGIPGMRYIAAGWHHSIAIDSTGKVWVWGSDPSGQYNETPTKVWDKPTCFTGLPEITKVVCGSWHTLAIDVNHEVWGWGKNHFGMLGKGDTLSTSYPVKIQGLSGVTTIGAGCFQSLAVDDEDNVWSFGDNPYGQQGVGDYDRNHRPQKMLVNAQGILSESPHQAGMQTGSLWRKAKWGLFFLSIGLNIMLLLRLRRRKKS